MSSSIVARQPGQTADGRFYVGQHVRVIKFGKYYGQTGGVSDCSPQRVKIAHRGPFPWDRWFSVYDVAEVAS